MQLLNRFMVSFVLSLFLIGNTAAQSMQNLDSLERVLKKEQTDTTTLKRYFALLKDIPDTEFDAKMLICNWMIKHCKTAETQLLLSKLYNRMGLAFGRIGNDSSSLVFLLTALGIAEANNFYEMESSASNNLANLYFNSSQTELSGKYTVKALAAARKSNNPKNIATALAQLGSHIESVDKAGNRKSQDSFTRVIALKKEALEIGKELYDTSLLINYYMSLAESFSDYGYYDSAFFTFSLANNMIEASADSALTQGYYFLLGKTYKDKADASHQKADYLVAIKYIQKSLELALRLDNKVWIYRSYDWLSAAYEAVGDYRQALDFKNKYLLVKDAVVDADYYEKLNAVTVNFKNAKKDKEIVMLNAANRKKTIFNRSLIAATAGLILLGFLGYRYFRERQNLQLAKITALEKDKQLTAIDAMLRSQEEERSRIAKDLHDGLGGMLSGTKLSFSNMKENLVLTSENAVLFDRSLSMLDNTISDLRKVAHNLMPEALVKFGLAEALRDYCISVQSASDLKVVYQQVGENRKLGNTAELFTYRIIQELVNNAIKHAAPNQILVQLNINSNKVCITVEDDGVGFDKYSISAGKGAGMDNIKYRVQYFNGVTDIVTSPGKGTSVNIELMA